MRVLLCDDDAILRRVVAGVARAAGHEVVGETDNTADALELVGRLLPDVIVLDLALAFGTGGQLIAAMQEHELRPKILVFSAFAADRADLIAGGASKVVEKPDFDLLEATLREWAEHSGPPTRIERRRDRIPRLMPHSTARSPGGLEPDHHFYAALGAAMPGDTLLVVAIATHGVLVSRDGAHVAADWLMELARITRMTIRAQDRMACFDGRRLHVLLVGGGIPGAESVQSRVGAMWEQISDEPLVSSYAVHEEDTSIEQLLHWASPAPAR
jgi:CheY-like chemotaxis protein